MSWRTKMSWWYIITRMALAFMAILFILWVTVIVLAAGLGQ